MATLSGGQRKNLPASQFAIPAKRAYPIPDAAHARDALARVAANGTPAQQSQVRAAVARRFPNIGKNAGTGTNRKSV